MRATISFTLPEEQQEFEMSTKGILYSIVLSDLDNYLRSKIKHSQLSTDAYEAYADARRTLRDLASDRKIEV